MPIYTYRCDNCGVRFERNQKFTDPPLSWCSECGKKALRKVYMPVGIVFKGSGFYATDHRSPSGGNRLSSEDKPHEKQAETKKPEDSASSAASTPSAPAPASNGSEA
jgi:putative FmdB family regulatory protein